LRSRYSDDLLWLPFVLCEYTEKTGDDSVLSVAAPYLCSPPLDMREHERYEELKTEGEGSVLEHALLAAHTVWARGFGAHGLLLFGGGDWNDGMNLVGARGKGESVWLTEFCAIVYFRLARLLERLGRGDEAKFFISGALELCERFSAAFDGEWYLRGYYDDGLPLGKKGNGECEIDALSQSFAVLAEAEIFGKVSERAHTAILAAYERLFDAERGIMKLLSPPFDRGGEKPGYIKGYLPGIRENGGQYTHAAVWAAMALMLAGEKEKGFSLLKAINPAVRSTEEGFLSRYKIEPYALAGDVYSHTETAGRGGWSHYTGAAAWYRKAVIETVFGLRLSGGGFTLSPHMPRGLDGAELSLFIRGTRYRLRFFFGGEAGIVLDGKIIEADEAKMSAHRFIFDGGEHTVDFCVREA
jgi:cyclic beta-1,2-glucan synthetase